MYISWGEVLMHLVTNVDISIFLQQQFNYSKTISESGTEESCIAILHKKDYKIWSIYGEGKEWVGCGELGKEF